jgi:hypothetical protein
MTVQLHRQRLPKGPLQINSWWQQSVSNLQEGGLYMTTLAMPTHALNWDPELARQWRMFIDKLHFKGRTACAASLDAGVLLHGAQSAS